MGSSNSWGQSFGFEDEGVTISIDAEGSVTAVPDMASVEFEFTTSQKTADEAQKENSKRVEAFLDKMEEMGIDKDNIQTESHSIYPEYDESLLGDSRKIISYKAYDVISVDEIDADEIGKIMAAGTKAGADVVSDVRYYCSDYDEKYDEALEMAVKRATEKAEVIAKAAGYSHVRITNVMTSSGSQNSYVAYSGAAMNSKAVMDETSYEAANSVGSIEISASLSFVFETY